MKFEKSIYQLIRTRDAILKTQNNFKKFGNPNEFGCSVHSIIKFFECPNKLGQDEICDIYNAWNIPKRRRVNQRNWAEFSFYEFI
jgi:hypothetical protein